MTAVEGVLMFATMGRVKPFSVASVALVALVGLLAVSAVVVVPMSQRAAAAPVNDVQWRNWVFGEIENHRAGGVGKTFNITTRYKDSAGDRQRIVLRMDPASGALHAEVRWNGSEYGYTVVCTQWDVCWYKNILPEARWVVVPAGKIHVKRLASDQQELFLGLIPKGDISKSRAVRRSVGSYTDYPTVSVYEDVRIRGGQISYRYLSKYMVSKKKAQGWSDTTWVSRTVDDAATFMSSLPQPVNVLDVPWGTRVIFLDQF